jgi:hypothetical protein
MSHLYNVIVRVPKAYSKNGDGFRKYRKLSLLDIRKLPAWFKKHKMPWYYMNVYKRVPAGLTEFVKRIEA